MRLPPKEEWQNHWTVADANTDFVHMLERANQTDPQRRNPLRGRMTIKRKTELYANGILR